MAKKKTEQLAWELRLIAPPGTIFSTSEDEDPSVGPQEDLGIDTQWPDMWIELPDQPDFEGLSAKAQPWLDKHAPVTGLYRLRRLVDEQEVNVQMVLTIQRLPVTFDVKGADKASKSISKASEAVELLDDAASKQHADRAAKKLAEEAADIDPRGPEMAAAVDPDALAEPLTDEQPATPPPKAVPPADEGEAAKPAANELDLAAAPPAKPKNGGSALTARAVWMASPLRKCRSLQTCCLCDEAITSGQQYYDRGYGKRAHDDCVSEMVDF